MGVKSPVGELSRQIQRDFIKTGYHNIGPIGHKHIRHGARMELIWVALNLASLKT